jgi:hypothetical protein
MIKIVQYSRRETKNSRDKSIAFYGRLQDSPMRATSKRKARVLTWWRRGIASGGSSFPTVFGQPSGAGEEISDGTCLVLPLPGSLHSPRGTIFRLLFSLLFVGKALRLLHLKTDILSFSLQSDPSSSSILL